MEPSNKKHAQTASDHPWDTEGVHNSSFARTMRWLLNKWSTRTGAIAAVTLLSFFLLLYGFSYRPPHVPLCKSYYETNFTFSRVTTHHTKRSVVPPAFNPLDPTTQYKHHPIISEYGFVTARKNKDHLLDWLGTWIDSSTTAHPTQILLGMRISLSCLLDASLAKSLMQRSASPI